MKIGLDIGSTTIKCVVLDQNEQIQYQTYQRHLSLIAEKTAGIIQEIRQRFPQCHDWQIAVSGSAGMGMANACGVPFIQEVYATKIAADRLAPGTDCIIELGGEDAKIIFLDGSLEARMNGTCAGGTGAFIDQMASLLNVSPEHINDLAAACEQLYTIPSRCGVFAKSDVQPLLNQGAKKSDIAASILYAVVNQTIGGLAQGRPIKGNVLYLGGPLTFIPMLRESFDKVLKTGGTCPEHSLYYVCLGAAYLADQSCSLEDFLSRLSGYAAGSEWETLPPLFRDQAEYDAFVKRHEGADVPRGSLKDYQGPVYIGIDAGSTTIKAVVMGSDGSLLCTFYQGNTGNPVPLVRDFLMDLYRRRPDLWVAGCCVTGYGEDIIRHAFHADYGLVETSAHFTAAKAFMPDVDFIVDIGGQDMKCFHVSDGVIDNIYLNEACSSGCGSFLQTFANALGYDTEEFARLGLFARGAVDLGSRCTVFMNSSVKQAQKDGATVGDISAGLSVSVVKNAIYKVIRPSSLSQLGTHIVVQGGTFLNDAVLRAFEQELGVEVVRPAIAGLMGAYGCALYARRKALPQQKSTLSGPEELKAFRHQVKNVTCGLCNNHCHLTVNTFGDGGVYIGGNRCQRPVTKKEDTDNLNIYRFKQEYMKGLQPVPGRLGIRLGLPLGLNLWEMAPFWHGFFTELGFTVVLSPLSARETFLKGQATIPSDTVCFPAKLLHGHVAELVEAGVQAIYYPCMSFNFDEHLGDNHYNCPVVAYYPETIAANMHLPEGIQFINDYTGPHNPKEFPEKIRQTLIRYFGNRFSKNDVQRAARKAYAARDAFLFQIREEGQKIIRRAREAGKTIICLAGRPYHADPEINHGIDMLLTGLGLAVISEDCLSHLEKKFPVRVLNQWTYHSRLYAAAKYICTQRDMQLVQLISFGCGLDAITSDETRSILQQKGKIYTQIKIDEITNLGTIKVRLRSLLAALEQKEK